MRMILKGVGSIHEMNIVHRDLKPDNILISMTKDMKLSDVKIADFGQAKKLDPLKLTNAYIQSKH